jgi:mRNA interferase RelE/StbE
VHRVELRAAADRELERLTRGDRTLGKRLIDAAADLGKEPRPAGCVKLAGSELYRIRVGNYRIIYQVDDGARLITVTRFAHRREAYR